MKSLWPKWLPYPISLVRATVVCGTFSLFIRFISSSIQDAAFSWHYYGGGIPDELIGAVFIGWLLIFPVAAFLHHWLMGLSEEGYYASHHPFVPGWKSLWEGAIGLGVAIAGFFLISWIPSTANFWIILGAWFIGVAYTYHLGYLFNSCPGVAIARLSKQSVRQHEKKPEKKRTGPKLRVKLKGDR